MLGKNANILVIKHGALGDIIQGLDAYASLRNSFPKAHITILTSAPFAPLMELMPYFNEVVIDHRARFWQLDKTLQIKALFKRSFDVVIDLQCSRRTNHYFRLFADKHGSWVGNAKGCSHRYPDFTDVNNHDRMLHGVRMVGADDHRADLSFLAQEGDVSQFDLTAPYAVLMPGCSPAKPSKKYPAASYGTLADMLYDRAVTPVVIGTRHDAKDCQKIASHRPFVKNLCEKTNLAQLASLCAGASLCVGNDSGPVFLAAKAAAPTLMIMGPNTDPTMSAPTGAQADYLKADDLAMLAPSDVWQKLQGFLP